MGGMNIAAWYERETGPWPMNYGQSGSQELARMIVLDGLELSAPADAIGIFSFRAQALDDDAFGWSMTVRTREQISAISQILDENLRQGALGVGSTVGYARSGTSTYELFDAQQVAARYGRPRAAHTRLHGPKKPPVESQTRSRWRFGWAGWDLFGGCSRQPGLVWDADRLAGDDPEVWRRVHFDRRGRRRSPPT